MKDKKYTIELSIEQLKVIREACEYYSRFCAGQMCLPQQLEVYMHEKYGFDSFIQKRNFVEKNFADIKAVVFEMGRNESIGIGCKELVEEAKVCYDIYRPILEFFAKKHNEEHPDEKSYSVYDYDGLSYSKQGRITIK